MKKMMRTFTVLVVVVLMLSAMAMPALAAEFDFETEISEFDPSSLNTHELKIGETHKPDAAVWLKVSGECYSSDETIVTVSSQGDVTAVAEGSAYIAIVSGNMSKVYRYDVVATNEESTSKADTYSDWGINHNFSKENDSFQDRFEETQNRIEKTRNTISAVQTVMVVIMVFVLLIGIAASVYIFITTPKCGMTRAWALAPVVGNVFGLIAFIMVRTVSKTAAVGTNTVVCPTCNAVHPTGTAVCNICGTKLQ